MDINGVRRFLTENDNYTILTHISPDGDTLGCGFGLCRFLRGMGKKANVVNGDGIPHRYDFLCEDYFLQDYEEKCVIAVDIADAKLMGDRLKKYQQPGAVDLCIDHHVSNTKYAKETLLDPTAGAAAMIIYEILSGMGTITKEVAACLYTGIATDTGCFRFENTDYRAHLYASKLIETGIDFYSINRKMFELKSRKVAAAERAIVSEMKFFLNDKVAVNVISLETIKKYGVEPAELEGIPSVALTIEGVLAGVTVKEKAVGTYKISLRTTDELNASQICSDLGGGGHIRAAGCEIKGELSEVINKIVAKISEYM